MDGLMLLDNAAKTANAANAAQGQEPNTIIIVALPIIAVWKK